LIAQTKQPEFTAPRDALLPASTAPTQTPFALPVSKRRLDWEVGSGADLIFPRLINQLSKKIKSSGGTNPGAFFASRKVCFSATLPLFILESELSLQSSLLQLAQ
jgi:hypothetical protein